MCDSSKPNEPPRVLVVEDMPELADLICEILMLHGFEVAIAPDGLTALDLLRNTSVQVALVDIDLPDISGFEVAERARALNCLQGARIVFCTGGDIEERRIKAQQFPGSQLLAKPFAVKGLLTTVADALASSGHV